MAANDISLVAGMRDNLLELTKTAKLTNRTQERLASGKRVNSSLDDPSNFFAAMELKNYADDLSLVHDNINNTIQTVKAASNGISAVSTLIAGMKSLVDAARITSDPAAKAKFARSYDQLYSQINSVVSDSSYNGGNLISDNDPRLLSWSSQNLPVSLNPTGTSEYVVEGKFLGAGYAFYEDGVPATGWVPNDLGTKLAPVDADATEFPVPGNAPTPLDFVFIIDSTGSMGGYINMVEANAKSFVSNMVAQGVDGRYSFVKYGDVSSGDAAVIAAPSFFTDPDAFAAAITASADSPSGGGDFPESGLEAILGAVSGLAFRAEATKRMVLLTDATVHTFADGFSAETIAGTAAAVSAAGIQLDIATVAGGVTQLTPLASATGGTVYDINDASFYTDNFGVTPDPATPTHNLTVVSADYDTDAFSIRFDPPGATKSMTAEKSGLGLYHSWVYQNFATEEGLAAATQALDAADRILRTESANFGSGSTILVTRDTLASEIANIVRTGSDNLTAADMNEEAANMLMLQTRQSLSTTSLSIASQSSQIVLKLF
uniref:Flagellin domain protein n=1 Tax=Geobacter sp. (strain M21) TaxID=443144 RepID=C6E9K0_GEOSM